MNSRYLTIEMNHLQELLLINMKAARKRLHISQARLAELVGVSTSFIGEIEIGRKFPSSGVLLRISQCLGLRPYQLFWEDQLTDLDHDQRITALRDFRDEMNRLLEVTLGRIVAPDGPSSVPR